VKENPGLHWLRRRKGKYVGHEDKRDRPLWVNYWDQLLVSLHAEHAVVLARGDVHDMQELLGGPRAWDAIVVVEDDVGRVREQGVPEAAPVRRLDVARDELDLGRVELARRLAVLGFFVRRKHRQPDLLGRVSLSE